MRRRRSVWEFCSFALENEIYEFWGTFWNPWHDYMQSRSKCGQPWFPMLLKERSFEFVKNRLTVKHLTSAGPQIIHQTIITTTGGNRWLWACKSLVLYLRFHQNGKPGTFSRRRGLDDVLTTSHMRRTLARENFTSARRRRAISLSTLKVPINISRLVNSNQFWTFSAHSVRKICSYFGFV